MRRRPLALLVVPLLFASLMTAALSHIIIGEFGALGIGGHAYSEHAHDGLALSLLTAALGFVTWLLAAVVRAVARRSNRDPVDLLVRRFQDAAVVPTAAAIAAGGLAELTGMEFFEQIVAFGHITGIGDALGGSAFVGLAIVVAVATLTAMLGLRLVRALLTTLVYAVVALLTWIDATLSRSVDRAARSRDERRLRRSSRTAYLARGLGLRAPPNGSLARPLLLLR